MSDSIALMNSGRVEQFGSPLELYDRPRTPFAASFLGNSNLLSGRLLAEPNGTSVFVAGELRISLPAAPPSDNATLLLRPEHLTILREATPDAIPGSIVFVTHLGYSVQYEVKLDAGPAFLVSVPRARDMVPLPAGARVYLAPHHPSAYQLVQD